MTNLINKAINGERLNRQETIALMLIQEAMTYVNFKYDSFENIIEKLNKEASELFQDKSFTLGTRIKKAVTNIELAELWLKHNINEDNEKVKEILPIYNNLKTTPREEGSGESLAIIALEEAMLWLSK